MKIVYILKQEPDQTVQAIIDETSGQADVTVVKLPKYQDYDSLVDLIEKCDRVVAW
jgi:hypothetical protein